MNTGFIGIGSMGNGHRHNAAHDGSQDESRPSDPAGRGAWWHDFTRNQSLVRLRAPGVASGIRRKCQKRENAREKVAAILRT